MQSLRAAAAIVVRESRLRATTRWLQGQIALATRTQRPVVAGPWMSEVGFELLYWIPLLRRLLHRHGISRERVVVITRGGAGVWYDDIAATAVDILDLVSVGEFRALQGRRQTDAGHQKQLAIDPVEREVLRRAGFDPRRVAWAHPLLAYSRLRYVFAGRAPLARLDQRCEFRHIAAPAAGAADPRLPAHYVAVKAYFSDCQPDTPLNRRRLAALVAQLAARTEVVLLDTGLGLDEHEDAGGAAGDRVRTLSGALSPAHNLAVQTRVIAGADAYVATYGGMSYLGAFLGIPTRALYSERNFNEVHLAAIRRAAAALDSPPFIVSDLHATAPEALAAAVLPAPAADR